MRSAWLGWVVSLFWEAASVWLWWRGDRGWEYRAAKYAATAALLGGMIAQGAGPLLMSGEAASQAASIRATATATLEKLLVAVVDQERKGFKDTLDKLLKTALEPPPPPPTDSGQVPFPERWKPALAWVPVFAFPTMYGLALLCLVTTAREWGSERPTPVPNRLSGRLPNGNANASGERGAQPNGDPNDAANAPERAAVIAYGRRHGLFTPNDSTRVSQAAVARKIGEPPSTLSEFVNGRTGPEKAAEILQKLTA